MLELVFLLAEKLDTIEEGIELAEEMIDSGAAAYERLQRLIEASKLKVEVI